jgi:predicted nucleic acid-binding protein
MEPLVVDTNGLSRLLDGHAEIELIMRQRPIYISVITWMEMQCKSNITAGERKIIKALLDDCYVIELNEKIKKMAVNIRLSTRMKLMDSIIASSAIVANMPLLTGDDKFKTVNHLSLIFVPVL